MGARLGQHFLKSENLLKEIANFADISKNDVILEIGAADGGLTKYLTSAKKVIAVELDKKLFHALEEKNLPSTECINMDILDFQIPKDVNKIIGNLPYELSSPVTEKILLFLNSQKREKKKNLGAILMYQREFAERMTAFPGLRDWSRLSVLVNYFSDCKMIKKVPRTAFRPAPKVESALVKLTPKNVEPDPNMLKVAKLLFMHKNKKVLNALIDSRQFLKEKDKDKLRRTLPGILGKLADKKVFYLEISEIKKISNSLVTFVTTK